MRCVCAGGGNNVVIKTYILSLESFFLIYIHTHTSMHKYIFVYFLGGEELSGQVEESFASPARY